MKRDPLQELAAFAAGTLLILFALCAVIITGLRGADAASPASVWGGYEGAVKGAFMRSEGEAFASVTRAIEDLPEIARVNFVKGVIVGLGLATTAPDSLDGGNIDPERLRRVRAALDGFENAGELLAIIERDAVEKPAPVVDDSATDTIPEPAPSLEPVDDPGVVPVEPRAGIEPREAVRP